MKKYSRPCINTYCTNDMYEVIGPIQTASVELQIYYQQIPQSQVKFYRIEKVINLAEKEKPAIYKLNSIA